MANGLMAERAEKMDNDVFFTVLEGLLKQMGYETALARGEDPKLGDTLRALLPVDEAGNKVLLDVMAFPYTEHALLAQIYTTMIAEIGPGYDALEKMLVDWNLTCPIGAYGIYREGRQFYHKYNYLMRTDGEAKEMAEEIFYIIHLVLDVIAETFPAAVRLSGSA